MLKQSWNATTDPGEMLNITARENFLSLVTATVTLGPPFKPIPPSDIPTREVDLKILTS
jgi:hypothetical protein